MGKRHDEFRLTNDKNRHPVWLLLDRINLNGSAVFVPPSREESFWSNPKLSADFF